MDIIKKQEPVVPSGTTQQYYRGDKTWQDFFEQVRAATLTGLSIAVGGTILATDTVLQALGKIQNQIDNAPGGSGSGDLQGAYENGNEILISSGDGDIVFNTSGIETYIDVSPLMTSNTEPSPYVVTSSPVSPAYAAWKAFNNVLSGDQTGILFQGASNHWLQLDLGIGNEEVITQYTIRAWITASYTGSSPKSWTFLGSNDGASWDLLDTRVNETNWVPYQNRSYQFLNLTSYRFYKLEISINNGNGSYTGMQEVDIFISSPTPTTPLITIRTDGVTSNNGGKTNKIELKGSDYQIVSHDHTILVDSTSSDILLTLLINPLGGQVFCIKHINGLNECRLDTSSFFVDGSTNDIVIPVGDTLKIQYHTEYGFASL